MATTEQKTHISLLEEHGQTLCGRWVGMVPTADASEATCKVCVASYDAHEFRGL